MVSLDRFQQKINPTGNCWTSDIQLLTVAINFVVKDYYSHLKNEK